MNLSGDVENGWACIKKGQTTACWECHTRGEIYECH